MSKGEGIHLKTMERHPRVLAYDNYGTDPGCFMVTTVKGFAFDDAAENVGDDPDARMACHSRSCHGVKDAIYHLSLAQPCKCGRCVGRN